jgi:hypothetical protein
VRRPRRLVCGAAVSAIRTGVGGRKGRNIGIVASWNNGYPTIHHSKIPFFQGFSPAAFASPRLRSGRAFRQAQDGPFDKLKTGLSTSSRQAWREPRFSLKLHQEFPDKGMVLSLFHQSEKWGIMSPVVGGVFVTPTLFRMSKTMKSKDLSQSHSFGLSGGAFPATGGRV